MIKGLYSLKSLKLSLTGFLISCFILLGGFTNAGVIGYVGIQQGSEYDNSYKILVNGKGNLLTTYYDLGKRLLMFDDGVYFFWGNNGLPYMYITSDSSNPRTHASQGFVNDYMICDYIGYGTGRASSPQNCTRYNLAGLESLLGRFLDSLSSSFYYYYDVFQYNASARNAYCGSLTVCFSSETFDKSLCFFGSNGQFVYPCETPLNYGNSDTNLSGGFGLSPYFDNINISYLGNSPSSSQGNINGSSTVVDSSTLTGDLAYGTCSNGYVLTQIDKALGGQWRYTCMAGISETGVELSASTMSTLNYNPGQGADFKTVYSLTNEGLNWSNWFSKYSNIYNQWYYNQSVYSTNPFYGKNALLFAYFKTLNDYGYNDSMYSFDLLNACKLLLYSDWNSSYSGSYFSNLCSNSNGNGGGNYTTGEVGSVDGEGEVLPPGYSDTNGGGGGVVGGGGSSNGGDNVVGSSWEGVISGHTNETNYDGTTFINDFFQKLKSSYVNPGTSAVGTLPSYILVFLCAIMLFKFIRK